MPRRDRSNMSEIIKVQLPDGSVKEVPKGTSALEIARGISPRLADAALAAKLAPLGADGAKPALVDLTQPIQADSEVRILTEKDPESLEIYRHSSAHLMA